jgi:hypothetical protein
VAAAVARAIEAGKAAAASAPDDGGSANLDLFISASVFFARRRSTMRAFMAG